MFLNPESLNATENVKGQKRGVKNEPLALFFITMRSNPAPAEHTLGCQSLAPSAKQRVPSTSRHRESLEERRRIAELCESSGVAPRDFARQHRIPLSSLQRWLAEARSARKEVPAVIFHEVSVSPRLGISASCAWAVEIVGPDGMTVRCRDGLSIDDLSLLLRGPRC
jgi:hypothetical protein